MSYRTQNTVASSRIVAVLILNCRAVTAQAEKAARFRRCTRAGVFVIANAWDAGSRAHARGPRVRGARHLERRLPRTRSAGFDGRVTRDEALAHAPRHRRGDRRSRSPPTSRSGFGDAPGGRRRNHPSRGRGGPRGRVDRGRDRRQGSAALRHRPRGRARRGRREAARALPFGFVLTARTENFISGKPDLDDTIRRLQAFERAGADVLFAPGPARPRCGAHGVRRGLEARQLHGRHPRQVLHGRGARSGRRAPR